MSTAEIVETAEERFREHYGDFVALGRRAVEAAWQAGAALAEVKASKKHGEWLPWLQGEGVKARTAERLMELARAWQIRQVCEFETVDAALLAAKEPAPTTAASIQDRGKKAGRRASAKVQQRQGEREQLRAAKDGEDVLTEELAEAQATVVSLKALLGDEDVAPDDAIAEFQDIAENQRKTIADLRKDLKAANKRADDAEAERDHWKAYATKVEEGLQHVNG